MVNSGNPDKSTRELDNVIISISDDDDDKELVKWIRLGCAGEGAVNDKRKAYIEELENLLTNQVLQCEEEAYKLYCDYAYAVGFSVRKGKQYYFPGTNKIRAKWYCCSKEGFSYDKDDGSSSIYGSKLEARTGCRAMIYFVCNNEGQWKASKFLKEHNHEMAELYERPLLRSARAILAPKHDETQLMLSEISNSGYGVQSSTDIMDIDSDEEDEGICLHCTGGEESDDSEDGDVDDVDNLEKKLLAKVVRNEEEAYKVYCDYAHIMGFSVRKGKQYYFPGTKKVRSKSYFCSKEGFVNEDISVATHNKLEARTGCKAMICFTCDDDGNWKVTKFAKDHNHKMAEPFERHLLRSARSTSDAAKGNGTSQAMMLDLNKGIGKAGSSGTEFVVQGDTILEPHEGMMFQSEDAAKEFYDEYARQIGFLMHVMPSGPLEVHGGNNIESVADRPNSEADCQAMILLKCDKSGKCIVSRFIRAHSHPLVIFPKEVVFTMDEKDRKILELKAELQTKRRLCGLYREQLDAVVKVVEEHTKEISRKLDLTVNNVRRFV